MSGVPGPPDAFDVVAAASHPDTRAIALDGRVVLRTPDRPDDPRGNAVLATGPGVGADGVLAALADARTRLAGVRAGARVVVRRGPDIDVPALVVDGATVRSLDVVVLDDAAAQVATWSSRADTAVVAPGDDRAWHGVTVLQRHAASPDDRSEQAARARGGRDEVLRWWVEGRRRMAAHGRARVRQAVRFGTPVAAATLVWDPGAPVGPGAAGLAVVADVVVHPAHRGLGVAGTVVGALLREHLDDFPRAQVAAVVPSGLTPALRSRGWRRHDGLIEVVDEAPAPVGR